MRKMRSKLGSRRVSSEETQTNWVLRCDFGYLVKFNLIFTHCVSAFANISKTSPNHPKSHQKLPQNDAFGTYLRFLALPINFLHCPCPLPKNGLNSNPYMSTWIRILVLLEWAPPVSLQQNFPRSFSVMAPILKILLCHWCQQRNAQEIEKKMSTHSSEGRRGIEEPTKMFSPSLQQILTAKIIS